MFILSFNSSQWCDKYWPTQFNVVSDVNSASMMFRVETPSLGEVSDLSILFGAILGLFLGCALNQLWNRHKWQSIQTNNSLPLNTPNSTKGLMASKIILSTVNDLISSQYVVKDRKHFSSLLQTPLRSSLEQLRLVADSLINDDENNAHYPFTCKNIDSSVSSKDTKKVVCDVSNSIAEQVEFMNSQQLTANSLHYNASSVSPILPVCPVWFSAAIRELLVNALKHNKHNKNIYVELSSSVENGNFVISIIDNGVGFSNTITQKLDSINIAKSQNSSLTSFVYEEPHNLACIKRMILKLNGSFEVVSARHYSTKIIVKLPLVESVDYSPFNFNKTSVEYNGLALKASLPLILLISPHSHVFLEKLELLEKSFNFICATSLQEGLNLAKNETLNCVLIDTQTAELKAVKTRSWLELSAEFANVPIAMLDDQNGLNNHFTTWSSTTPSINLHCLSQADIIDKIKKVIFEKQSVRELVSEGIANYHLRMAEANKISDHENTKFLDSFALLLKVHHKNEKFNRPTAAKLMLMTEKTLARRLNQHYKLGFAEKLRQFRLLEGKNLLLTGAKVTTVAYDTGFSSPSYFAQCFRAEFGFAPSMLSKPV